MGSRPPINIDDAVKNAKGALATANKKFPSPAPAPTAPAAKPAAASSMPSIPMQTKKDAEDIKGGLKWRADQTKSNSDVLGQFKDGGKVPKTGNYKLHEGEKVLTKDEVDNGMSAMADKAKPKVKLHIEPSDNDGFITQQHPATGPQNDDDKKVHVHPDLDHLVDHIKATYGDTSSQEASERKGDKDDE